MMSLFSTLISGLLLLPTDSCSTQINEVKIENYKVFLIKKPKRRIVFSSLEYNVALEKGLPRQGH